ncbi:hypothetical protein O3W44_23255 [Pantoea sp. LMR881]|uniref:hypothetical protein n=1 Tax=Pantoea sp. LMR881 TaxID=3014336 RepID=UPI0022B079DF|nr:hypothetical protein [Pantoea sp. LMR881]MCZ4061431.1 hypothetical protein [Pantoea sp. LMR881]
MSHTAKFATGYETVRSGDQRINIYSPLKRLVSSNRPLQPPRSERCIVESGYFNEFMMTEWIAYSDSFYKISVIIADERRLTDQKGVYAERARQRQVSKEDKQPRTVIKPGQIFHNDKTTGL